MIILQTSMISFHFTEAPDFQHAFQFCFSGLFTGLLTTAITRLQTMYLSNPPVKTQLRIFQDPAVSLFHTAYLLGP